MPRNFLANRSLDDLASEYVIRRGDPLAPVKLYSSTDLLQEMIRRWTLSEREEAIHKAEKAAEILGM